MVIHVVRPGESVYSISRLYNVPYSKIINDNELSDPGQLVIGQTLVILNGILRHRVVPGQSLYSIAREYGVTVDGILDINPQITDPAAIYPGQIINVPAEAERLGTIYVNGYAYPNINMDVLRRTLPNLTYLSIFSHEVNRDGTLRTINDEPLIRAAREANVAPLLVITNIEDGGFSSDLAREVLTNEDIRENLITNIIQTIETKNYFGLDIDFEYVYPDDREAYNNFVRIANERLNALGYPVSSALAPKIAADQRGVLYEAHDYSVHGAFNEHVILMTYEWGYTFGPAMAVAPVNQVRRVLDYAVTDIPSEKILMGIPNYGYNWTLPFVQGSRAVTLSNTGAVDLARRVGAAIQYDNISQAPFFRYYDEQGRQHEVWFEDARSIEAKLLLVDEYDLGGISYWTIGRYFPQNWLVLNAMYNIRKVI